MVLDIVSQIMLSPSKLLDRIQPRLLSDLLIMQVGIQEHILLVEVGVEGRGVNQ